MNACSCSARFRGQQRRRDELLETAQAEGRTSELLREEGEGERRRELQAAALGYSSKHRSLSSASLRKLSFASLCPAQLPAARP